MTVQITLVVLFVISMLIMSNRSEKKKIKVLFFGDSLTEIGVLPGGFISLLNSIIQKEGFGDLLHVSGSGKGGDKVYDLYLRLEKDELVKESDVVCIFIGTNDIWHKQTKKTGTDIEKFIRFYKVIIQKIEAGGGKPVICTPAVIGERRAGTNPLDEDIDHFTQRLLQLSAEMELPIVNLRTAFQDYYFSHNPNDLEAGILTSDGVHFNDKGNQLVAKEMWRMINDLK